ncbi:UNVERIFIED_CONTAM: hypothetical protein FKN15_022695 [Acipenser sinensis]
MDLWKYSVVSDHYSLQAARSNRFFLKPTRESDSGIVRRKRLEPRRISDPVSCSSLENQES